MSGRDWADLPGVHWYRLDGRTPVRTDDRGYQEQYCVVRRARRLGLPGEDLWRVDLTAVSNACHVSTVFLGLDHGFDPGGPPLLFETMTFGSGTDYDGAPYLTPTWDAAQAMHDQVVAGVQDALGEGAAAAPD